MNDRPVLALCVVGALMLGISGTGIMLRPFKVIPAAALHIAARVWMALTWMPP